MNAPHDRAERPFRFRAPSLAVLLLGAVALIGLIAPAATGAEAQLPAAGAPTGTQAPAAAPVGTQAPAGTEAPTGPKPLVQEATAESEGTVVRLRAARASVEAGEPLVLLIEARLAPGTEIRFERFGSGAKSALGDFDVRAARMLPVDPGDPALRVQELRVVSFRSGVVELPAMEVTLVSPGGAERRVPVGPLVIDVTSLIGDADPREALRPVKDPAEIRFPVDWRVFVAVAAGVAAFALVCAVIWRLVRQRAAVPPPPPHVVARSRLASLRGERLPSQGRVLEYYVRLSDIVRGYVEGRFGIRAPEQTTKEFLAAATHHPLIHDGHRTMLAGFLRSADRVKFAAERPGEGDCDRAFDAANAFVDETAPLPGAEPAGAPGTVAADAAGAATAPAPMGSPAGARP